MTSLAMDKDYFHIPEEKLEYISRLYGNKKIMVVYEDKYKNAFYALTEYYNNLIANIVSGVCDVSKKEVGYRIESYFKEYYDKHNVSDEVAPKSYLTPSC